MLSHNWQAISLTKTSLTKAINDARISIDTFGKQSSDLKGVVNLDSFKKLRTLQLENDIREQELAIKNLKYSFTNNGFVNISMRNPESPAEVLKNDAKWSFTPDNQLLIDERDLTGVGDPIYYNIVLLNNKELKLQSVIGNDTTEMLFKRID